ncbi:AI-2E family transporter [Pseudooceanicola spongiae]|nr:AI-2E family transporter [Pseudooceanicola spongiae]
MDDGKGQDATDHPEDQNDPEQSKDAEPPRPVPSNVTYPTPPTEPPRPDAMMRRMEYMLAALLVLFLFWSISLAKVVMLPLVLGLLIALTLAPLVRWLGKLGIPAGVAAVLIIFSIGSAMAYGIYMMRYPAQMLIQQAPEIQQELRIKLWDIAQNVERMQKASEQMQELAGGSADQATQVVVNDGSMLQTALASLAGTGSALIIAMLLAMFLLASGNMFQHKLVESFPDFGNKRRARRISRDVERQISRYLGAITVINAGLGIAIGATLHLLGMPYGLLWGVAAFALNYLPYLGGMLGTAVAGAVALVTFDSVGHALLVPISYMTLTSIEGQMITPYLVGRHLRLNAAAVFVAVIFWAWLWGVAGALMAVPFLVFLKVLCDNIPGLYVIALFLDGETRSAARERKIALRRKHSPRRRGVQAALSAGLNAAASIPPRLPGRRRRKAAEQAAPKDDSSSQAGHGAYAGAPTVARPLSGPMSGPASGTLPRPDPMK